MRQGTLVRGFGGFYAVRDAEGQECTLRCKKKFRRLGLSPLVGDEVLFTPGEGEEHGWLEEILPRSSQCLRPPVANVSLLLIVVELADIYNFINKGFSFETGDKMLRLAADVCIECTGKDVKIGRFEHTKFGMILEQFDDDKIGELTQILWEKIIGNIRKLNVDKVKASMISIYYARRKNNDEAENMLSRTRKYLSNSLAIHRYGIGTRDKKQG